MTAPLRRAVSADCLFDGYRLHGIAGRLGRPARGRRADMVALDPERVAVLRTWVAGEADRPG